jgi:hypothetical protein
VAPWKWPKLYPDDWLQFVNMEHTKYTAEVRTDEGLVVEKPRLELLPELYLHPTRDLAVTHFADEAQALVALDRLHVRRDLTLRPEASLHKDYSGVSDSLSLSLSLSLSHTQYKTNLTHSL